MTAVKTNAGHIGRTRGWRGLSIYLVAKATPSLPLRDGVLGRVRRWRRPSLLRPTLAHVLVERVSSTNDAMSAVVTYDVQRDVSDMTTCLLIF